MMLFSQIYIFLLYVTCVTLFINKSLSLKCNTKKPFLFVPKFYLSENKYLGGRFCSDNNNFKYRNHNKCNIDPFYTQEVSASNSHGVYSLNTFNEYGSKPTHSTHEVDINQDSRGFLQDHNIESTNNTHYSNSSANEISSLCSYDESPHLLSQIQSRLNNYEDLTNKFGVNPYPEIRSIDVYDTFSKVISENESLKDGEEVDRYYTIFGRVEGIRFDGHFMDLVNINKEFKNYLEADLLQKKLQKNIKLQIMFRSDEPILLDTGNESTTFTGSSTTSSNTNNSNDNTNLNSYLCKEVIRLVDIGDVLELYGNVKKTKLGELSLVPKRIKILSKCLIPLPSKQHGLKDVETRFRLRHLDLLSNEESRVLLLKRFQTIAKIRQFLNDRGFVEIDTPILQHYTSGDDAEPFETYYRRLQQKVKLRIAPEFSLKKLLMGLNLTKVYEIGKCFRNEGTSLTHSPEFTMIEIYQKMADYKCMIDLFEKLVNHLLSYTVPKLNDSSQDDINSTTNSGLTSSTNSNNNNADLNNDRLATCHFEVKWVRKRFQDLIKEYTGVDITMYNRDELLEKLNELVDQKAKESEMKLENGNNELNDQNFNNNSTANPNTQVNNINCNINGYSFVNSNDDNTDTNNTDKQYQDLNTWGDVANEIFEKFVVPHLKYPVHVTHLPMQISPLCYYDSSLTTTNSSNSNRSNTNNDKDSRLFSNRFESYLGGMEVANGCTEQCNPLILSKALVDKENKSGENEHNNKSNMDNNNNNNNNNTENNKDNKEVDKEFLHSVFCGSEPMAGLGIGVDRLVMYITKTKNIKEIQPLPSLKKV